MDSIALALLLAGHVNAIMEFNKRRVAPGNFLTSILINDLAAAAQHADDENRPHIPAISSFVCALVPVALHGSAQKVAAHLNGHDMTDRQAQRTLISSTHIFNVQLTRIRDVVIRALLPGVQGENLVALLRSQCGCGNHYHHSCRCLENSASESRSRQRK